MTADQRPAALVLPDAIEVAARAHWAWSTPAFGDLDAAAHDALLSLVTPIVIAAAPHIAAQALRATAADAATGIHDPTDCAEWTAWLHDSADDIERDADDDTTTHPRGVP